jgi:NADPH2:quinone reductase
MIASSAMRSIVVREFGAPDVMKLEDVAALTPGPDQVLVRVRAAGVNPVDAYIRTGTYARKPPLPYTPGTDGAGEVAEIGSEVRGFAPGDRVYIAGDNVAIVGAGTYAEQALCSPAMLHRLPARTTFAQGAAMGVPYGTAYRSLFIRANARAGETVLVHGATGGVGIASVQLARAHGMRVFGSGGTDKGLQLLRDQGVEVVLNHRNADYLDAVMAATNGRGVDLVLEMAAHINLDKDLGILARNGRVVVIGTRGRVEIDPRQTFGRDAAIMGMTLFNSGPAELAAIHMALVAGLESGALAPVVGRELPLAVAPAAHAAVLEGGAVGKIVLTI